MRIEEVKEITLDDLFTVGEMLGAIGIDNIGLTGDNKTLGMNVLKLVIKNGAKAKKPFYTLVSSLTDLDVKEVKTLNLTELKVFVNKFLEVNNLTEVFTQARELI